jgi:hypothetical protein
LRKFTFHQISYFVNFTLEALFIETSEKSRSWVKLSLNKIVNFTAERLFSDVSKKSPSAVSFIAQTGLRVNLPNFKNVRRFFLCEYKGPIIFKLGK